jgi:hypothetical protein
MNSPEPLGREPDLLGFDCLNGCRRQWHGEQKGPNRGFNRQTQVHRMRLLLRGNGNILSYMYDWTPAADAVPLERIYFSAQAR